MRALKKGDYVLAMKWNDGDPRDHWAVGFYDRVAEFNSTRHLVTDANGVQFRNNGFRRVQKISAERGKFLVENKDRITGCSASLLFWLRATRHEMSEFIEAFSI